MVYSSKEMLKVKLLPFAKECKKDRLSTIVQEDNALSHSQLYQGKVYSLWEVLCMLWPSNSPDLNAIETTWAYMKKKTTIHGAALHTKQRKQDWIERIPRHIQEVIRLSGCN